MPTKVEKKPIQKQVPPRKRGRPRKVAVPKEQLLEAVEKEQPKPPVTDAKAAEPEKKPTEETPKKGVYFYAMGRRKTASAKIRAYENSNQFTVNSKPFSAYFKTKDLQKIVLTPLSLLGLEKKVGFEIFISGGGTHSQAEAVRHGIARTLILRNPEDKSVLKKAGLLTRDPRVKERKKPGLRRARRGPQWAKR